MWSNIYLCVNIPPSRTTWHRKNSELYSSPVFAPPLMQVRLRYARGTGLSDEHTQIRTAQFPGGGGELVL